MPRIPIVLALFIFLGCREQPTGPLSAQEIVDRAIEVAGGDRYRTSHTNFAFRGRHYSSGYDGKGRWLKRITVTDSTVVEDILSAGRFVRKINDSVQHIPDSMAVKYSNSVNSVHYFAKLPYGLNDRAVRKELLGEEEIRGRAYYEVKVTFAKEGGGTDYEDIFLYWFDKQTFKPDYLAYEFHSDGGGIRFREAYNERYVNGLRFVDYRNYSVTGDIDLPSLDSLFVRNELHLHSRIELKDVAVIQGSDN